MFQGSRIGYGWYGSAFKRALPSSIVHLDRDKYTSAYDQRLKIPAYVYEAIDLNSIKGSLKRKQNLFSEDPDIPPEFRSQLSDYKESGYDRGHVCPAAHCRATHHEFKESFYLSNIAPQNREMNSGQWNDLEQYLRFKTREYKTIEIFSGTAFIPKVCADGKKRVIYEVIGDNDVAVPTHFYKVCLFHCRGSAVEKAYLIPNQSLPSKKSFHHYETALGKVEKATGLLFQSMKK